ncbi:PAQR family membrane homeostasis protein TrhA [Sediminispirochaeta bajacaliforniensis]|uniref:PAQR family membrane homeostasis protein TrhA n=1 Tax=Sediminispirochaeta bajacaliforniensis TaxID=148 RepID=UPI00036649A0|nr:hemolysin III family protein [Sediminispirochaeta bajacaliforniensis]
MSVNSWLEQHITLHDHDNRREETANALTHFLGAILSVGAIIWIFLRIPYFSRRSMITGAFVYVVSMFVLYTASGLYHALPKNNLKRICRILDHANIYFLIAGTYTPIFIFLNSRIGWILLASVWIISALGVLFTLVFWGRYGALHVVFYLAMGWMIVFFWKDIIPFLPSGLTSWILAGGITYSAGVIFYAMKKLPYYHAIWHLFVLGGSILFFIGFAEKLFG